METTKEKAALSIKEGADYIGCSIAHFYRLVGAREIKTLHSGRRHLALRAELDRYLQERMAEEHGAEAVAR